MNTLKKVALAAACTTLLSGAVSTAFAANWLMLQGTEAADAAPRAYVWGFIQTKYQKDYSDANASGGYIPPKLVGPDLTSQESFSVNRARIGVRGTGMPLDSSVNYFFLAEFGNNGITQSGNSFAKITDASITLNQIPGARIRAGLFKTPGSEEVYQGIAIFDYINFTNFANQQLIERSPNDTYTANVAPQTLPVGTSLNTFTKSVSAARDTGVQIFDTFKSGNWEHSYSFMKGNGNGLNLSDNDGKQDTYLYWSSELVTAGAGPRRKGLKMYAWSQSGTRLLDNTAPAIPAAPVAADHNPKEYDRKRSGIGAKYLSKKFRVAAEYAKAKGMIWLGPHAATFDMDPTKASGNGENGEASAWQLDLGWYINNKWELDARYDIYNRLENDTLLPNGKGFETEWKTLTLGVQYHMNKKSRLTLNYAMRDVTAVDWSAGAGPNGNLDGIGNVLAVQLTHIF